MRWEHLDEFVGCYFGISPEEVTAMRNPAGPVRPPVLTRIAREASWSESNPQGRWRCFDYEDIIKRDKVNLDIFWLKDDSLEDAENLPEPDELAKEIADDLFAAFEQFNAIAAAIEA